LRAFANIVLAITAIIVLPLPSAAQDPTAIFEKYAYEHVAKTPMPGEVAEIGALDAQYHEYRMVQERNRFFAIILTVVTALVAHFLLLWRLGSRSPEEVVTGTALIYIVFGTIVLVNLSDNKDQLTASMGILGAVAGYLFGRTRSGAAPRPDAGAGRTETRAAEH
jgi:hypothetical protein